ncbi:MAG: sigma-70 family RNA polymerase sigma factor [Acidobacteria bacterium]|nr:sigma-70 family RNA polymerase sigma factor [Acidobacteriota bacterium]
MDDFDVINRVQAGDVEAFSILVEKYHRHLLNFIFRLTGDEQLVEDIGQDVFLRVYKSIRKFDIERGVPFSAWLFITARNRCISEFRRRSLPLIPIGETTDFRDGQRTPEETAALKAFAGAV